MNKHTPGPWSFEAEEGFCSQIDSADGSVICCFDEDPKPADICLMAAAPELLTTLQIIQQRLEACAKEPISAADAYDSFYRDLVEDAIAQATGRAS